MIESGLARLLHSAIVPGSWSSDALLVHPYSLQEHDSHHSNLMTVKVMEMLGSICEEVFALFVKPGS